MGKYFGTDGIRGIAGKFPLTGDDAFRLGSAAGRILKRKTGCAHPRWLIVRDTRESGAVLGRQLGEGLAKEGVLVFDGGVMSTPAAAYLVRAHRFDSGAVISASHNPPKFNGIKFFNSLGRKWPEPWELAVESLFEKPAPKARSNGAVPPLDYAHLISDYADFLVSTLPKGTRFDGMKIALDCSNGANHIIAPKVFRALGAQVFVIGSAPNGKNINLKCGSQDTKKLGSLVRARKCDFGVAYDGDGDRVIFTDEKGAVVDGDCVIGLLAKDFKNRGILRNHKAVLTVMANLGLRKALSRLKIKTVETPVGDKYVSEAMRLHRCVIGGEQSGHIILGEHLPTGDGLLTSIHVSDIARRSKKSFSNLFSWIKKYPQILLNLPVPERRPLKNLKGVPEKMDQVDKRLDGNGRVLVRYSGTEPLLRIMLEGPTQKEIANYAEEIAATVRAAFSKS